MTPDRWFTIWFSIGCVVVGGLISWFWSRHYYRRADKRRSPTFAVGKNQKVLASPELFRIDSISILENGQPKKPTYIRELLVYFWNSGTLAIQPSEVFEPFTIRLPYPILQCEVLKTSRPVVRLQVGAEPLGGLRIDFSVLEPNDGATIRILYEGEEEATPTFRGTCLDVAKPTVLPPADFYIQTRWQRIQNSPLFAVPVMVSGFLVVVGVVKGLSRVANKFPWLHLDIMGTALLWLFFGCAAVLVLFSVIFTISADAKKILSSYIPPDIKP
jgi:hypothetical protein